MKHCLIVDDSLAIRKAACSIFKALDFDTREAESGAAALEACRADMPDVILLDLQMPSMSGAEFLRSLRRQARGAHPFVILFAADNDVQGLTAALDAGADEYVMKPLYRDRLAQKLAQAGVG